MPSWPSCRSSGRSRSAPRIEGKASALALAASPGLGLFPIPPDLHVLLHPGREVPFIARNGRYHSVFPAGFHGIHPRSQTRNQLTLSRRIARSRLAGSPPRHPYAEWETPTRAGPSARRDMTKPDDRGLGSRIASFFGVGLSWGARHGLRRHPRSPQKKCFIKIISLRKSIF